MSFSDLIGQHELRQMLTMALTGNRFSHAILITGPAGSGKKSWGMALSQAVLCRERLELEPCMTCQSCRSFMHGNHPDFFLIKPDGRRIKIEQLRSIRENFFLQGSKKVCLIEQAEMMTAESASSLLKILEEPPPGLHFVLLAEQPKLLFDTIVSRCQRYSLHPLNINETIDLLNKKIKIPYEKAAIIARISGGLPGYAFTLAGDEEFEKRFNEAKTLAYNLATGRDSAFQLISWAATLVEREDLRLLLEMVCLLYRDGLLQNLCRGGDNYLSPSESTNWTETVAPLDLEEAVLLINETMEQLNRTNVNRQLLLEKMFIMLQRRLLNGQSCRGSF